MANDGYLGVGTLQYGRSIFVLSFACTQNHVLHDAAAKLNYWKRDGILRLAKDLQKQGKTELLSFLRGVLPKRVKAGALTPSRPCSTTVLVKVDSLKHWCLDQQEVGYRRKVYARQQFDV